ncbi:MAG: hypothetical protein FJ363_04825 [Gemmatimonadetes bacterium]|nr:hypothetical protein [Gemmatimonadota bacterium]
MMRRLLGLIVVASATAGAQVEMGAPGARMAAPTGGRPTSTYFTLGTATPTGALKDVGKTGYALGLSIQRSFGPHHFIGWRLDLPLAAGAESAEATTGWTYLSPGLGVVVSGLRERSYVLPYAFASLTYNRVGFMDLASGDEISDSGMGQAFGAGVELPISKRSRIGVELRTVNADLDMLSAKYTSLSISFISGGIRPGPR